jgi:GH24 family phage-related lysozyme (muramidase)|tara:strand:+ start:911 stop:2059 length:1149 start_codon:yes stop_codon:yes gene_type:complete
MAQTFSKAAVEIIKEFEGLELSAYKCSANVVTIGYGHTGGVELGDTCTPEQAETWLVDDMDWANDAVLDYVRVDLPQSAHDALVSFAYNIGPAAFGDSTLVKRLNAGESIVPVIEQELPRWVNGGGAALPGLVRRRDAEVELARQGASEPPLVAPQRTISLVDAAKYFSSLPHQIAAFEELEDLLSLEELDAFAQAYRNAPKAERILNVPYFYQLDSDTDHGGRMCFSSTNAMLLEYLEPGTLSGGNGDDEYLDRVFAYGDTTSAEAQVLALRSYGIDCEFVTDGTAADIEDQLARGYPVPAGWLHYGPPSNPTGGGHWSLVISADKDAYTIHDPFGFANLSSGGYQDSGFTAGKAARYPRKDWFPRWAVEGDGTGWMIRVN